MLRKRVCPDAARGRKAVERAQRRHSQGARLRPHPGWSLGHRWCDRRCLWRRLPRPSRLTAYRARLDAPDDQSELSLSAEMPEGSSLEATEQATLEVASKVARIPGVRAVLPTSSRSLDRVTMSYVTILQTSIGAAGLASTLMRRQSARLAADYAHLRARIIIALGGGDTFRIRSAACSSGPDLVKLVEVAKLVAVEMRRRAGAGRCQGQPQSEQSRAPGEHRPRARLGPWCEGIRHRRSGPCCSMSGEGPHLNLQRRARPVPVWPAPPAVPILHPGGVEPPRSPRRGWG